MCLSIPMIFTQMTKFCNRWFSDSERTIATVICALTIPCGNLVAFMLSSIVFRGIEKQSLEQQRATVDKMIYTQEIWMTVVAVPYMILLRDKPERPASVIIQDGRRKLTFCQTVKAGIKNKNYIILLVIMFLLLSTFCSFGTNIDELLSPPYNTSDLSGLGIAVSIIGVVASFLWGLALKKYQKFVL